MNVLQRSNKGTRRTRAVLSVTAKIDTQHASRPSPHLYRRPLWYSLFQCRSKSPSPHTMHFMGLVLLIQRPPSIRRLIYIEVFSKAFPPSFPIPSLPHFPSLVVPFIFFCVTVPSLVMQFLLSALLMALPLGGLAATHDVDINHWSRHLSRRDSIVPRNNTGSASRYKLEDFYRGQSFLECVVLLPSLLQTLRPRFQ